MKRHKFLETLSRLPAITASQAARFFDGDMNSLMNEIPKCEARGLLTISTELVRGRSVLPPLAVIKPGDALPCAGRIAYQAQKRWDESFVPTLVIKATAQLSVLYGSEFHRTPIGHLSHDLALSEVLLQKAKDPEFSWTLAINRPGTPLPDAFCNGGDVLIEIIGFYNRSSVSSKLGLTAAATMELY